MERKIYGCKRCEVLDKTSNTVFNVLTADIIMGFFTFGSTWWKAIGRSFLNWWNNAKRYKNLHALWQDVTENVEKMQDTINLVCSNNGITDEKIINLVKNCVRLTLTLCARTYQLEDTRSRWNAATRSNVYNTLVKTKIGNDM